MTADAITVVRGEPDEEELAAVLVALLMTRPQPPVAPLLRVAPAWTQDMYRPPNSWAA
jgi:hypothetical protein